MTRKYVVIIKKERNSEIVKCEELGLTIKMEKNESSLNSVELEVSKRRNRFIKKTVTIPEYLNSLGMRENLNFSQILAEGLREKLKIK